MTPGSDRLGVKPHLVERVVDAVPAEHLPEVLSARDDDLRLTERKRIVLKGKRALRRGERVHLRSDRTGRQRGIQTKSSLGLLKGLASPIYCCSRAAQCAGGLPSMTSGRLRCRWHYFSLKLIGSRHSGRVQRGRRRAHSANLEIHKVIASVVLRGHARQVESLA